MNNALFEIAYATVSDRICFFTGTGFSKAITEDQVPSWQELLENICDLIPNSNDLKEALFSKKNKNPLNLDEVAQILSLELVKINKNIYDEIAHIIASYTLSNNNISAIKEFFSTRTFKAITTNYDKLLEELTNREDCQSLTPGLPITRIHSLAKVYHIHGSIDSPSHMIVTSEDYFKFINSESYFSRKLSTILHENTIVILGYSLSDTNLKAILNDFKGFSKNYSLSSNIFLVSRSKINQQIKDYYSYCYGIRVLDGFLIEDFFNSLNKILPNAKIHLDQSNQNIKKAISQEYTFPQDFLRIEISFFEIISSISMNGLSINNKKVVPIIGEIIKIKIDLTGEPGAWDQYEHLAKWLIYLGSILEIQNTPIEDIYLKGTFHSMKKMSERLVIGYSWQTYKEWNSHWPEIIASNRLLIKNYIEKYADWHRDALKIVQNI